MYWPVAAFGDSEEACIGPCVSRPRISFCGLTEFRMLQSLVAGYGTDEVLRSLLELQDIDVNMENHKGRTPLAWAAAGNGHASIVAIIAGMER